MDICISNKANDYASRFNVWKKKTAMSYIEMAKVVVEAKENLGKERFEQFANLIGYKSTDSFISKLYRIGLQADLFEKNIDQLPSSFTTLYSLTTINNHQLVNLFKDQRITPSLKGSQINSLVSVQKRYRSIDPNKKSSAGEIIDIDVPLEIPEPIAVHIDMNVTDPQLVQFLRQLELLTRKNGISVSLPDNIRQRISHFTEAIM
jgi:hypothetical protein